MATFNDYETSQYMTTGIHFCKITDIEDYYNGRNYFIRVRFATEDLTHVESYCINVKAMFRIINLFDDLGLSRADKDNIDIKDKKHPEQSIKNICDFCKEYILFKFVKIRLEPSKLNPNYLTITQIRGLKDEEKATHSYLLEVINKFPDYDNDTDETNMNNQPAESSEISDEDVPF